MSQLFRFGVSLSKNLVEKFDRLIKEKKYTNRSKAIGDLIRQELVKKEWEEGKKIAGAITLIYNHHKREILNKIIHVQHNFNKVIISTQHIHLDHNNCLEIIAIKGNSKETQELFDALKSIKGVKHVTLNMSSTGRGID
ncbi:MAG: nickel-responsive transcriptional regulator NikR [Candidatus Omnitrophica bacterium]|nr:nickel-responsive transcriptional regulator NikR [Candidatus Omnitrophota bacterium]